MKLDDIELLSLDAGNTVIFLDHARLSQISGISAAKLIVAEGVAKRAQSEKKELVEVPWANRNARGAKGWGVMMATMFANAGIAEKDLPALIDQLWESHVALNLYSKVPDGFRDAMRDVRSSGVKVAIVSNSEGMLDSLFEKLGILDCFDAVIDSAKVGFEKPDKRIFEIACERTSTKLAHTLHLGDTMATDIDGANAAGARSLLIDPFRHYESLYPEVERAIGVVEVAHAITNARLRE